MLAIRWHLLRSLRFHDVISRSGSFRRRLGTLDRAYQNDWEIKMRHGVAPVAVTLKHNVIMSTMKILAIVGSICLSATASAGTVTSATITQIEIATSYAAVFVAVSAAKTGNPSCSTNGTWGFVMPLTSATENQMLALLLSARATSASVTLIGSGLCDTYSGIETLQYVLY